VLPRGSDYVITALVPELAVMLVKEDLKASDQTVRHVLQESARLGRYCCTRTYEAPATRGVKMKFMTSLLSEEEAIHGGK
jgi:hypothetical protein